MTLTSGDAVDEILIAVSVREATTQALLVTVAATCLREIGLAVLETVDAIKETNLALYAAVCEASDGRINHNARPEQLVSVANEAHPVFPMPR